jgi:lipopolysaccharide transport system permease protein
MGVFRVWLSMGADLVRAFPLGWRLFIRDFRSKYRQQIFGVLWVVIGPFVAVLTYALLARAEVLRIEGIGVPYPVYSYLGFTIWSLVQGIITSKSAVMNTSSAFIKQINFPRESLLFSPLFISLIDFSIKFAMFALLCLYYAFPLYPLRAHYLLLLIPALLFATGLGMVFAVVGAVVKDIANLLTFFFQFLLLITPVMYPYPAGSAVGKLASVNPFYFLTVVPRDLYLYGETGDWKGFLISALAALAVFLAGWRFFKVATSRIVEKI